MDLSFLRKRAVEKHPVRTTWLEVSGTDIPVVITVNSRARRLTLRLVPGGKELRITVPPHTPFREIDAFLYKHRQWAADRLSSLPEVMTIEDGREIKFRGIPHRIVLAGNRRGVTRLVEQNNEVQIHIYGDPRHIKRRLVDFIKKQARLELTKSVQFHAKNLGVKPGSITLRDTKTRWGSCSSTGALSFSWRIVLAPPDVLDYLAAHEVAHLREMNHSSRFWKLVEQTCPHTRSSKAWLKKNGASLHALIV